MEAEFTYGMDDTKYGVTFRGHDDRWSIKNLALSAWSRGCYGSIVAERSDSCDELSLEPSREKIRVGP